LTGLRRHGNTDDLARSTLQKEDITNADEVALDGHATTLAETRLNITDSWSSGTTAGRPSHTRLADDGLFIAITVVMVVMVGEWVDELIGSTFHSTAEAVVLTFVVVVTHVSFNWLVELDVCLFNGDVLLNWSTTLVFYVVCGILKAAAVVAFSDVELGLKGAIVGLALTSFVINVDVVLGASTVNLNINVC